MTARAAVLAAALTLLLTAVAEAADVQQRLIRVDVESGAVTTLEAAAADEVVSWRPLAIRPDGSMILHVTRDGPVFGDFLEERAADGALLGSRPRRDTHHLEEISPDLASVAFYDFGRNRSYASVARTDGSGHRRVAWVPGVGIDSSWAGGRLVVAREARRTIDVMLFSRSFTVASRTRCPGSLYPSSVAGSPDGARSALAVLGRGFGGQLAIVDHAARRCRILPVRGKDAAWSADSRSVAVSDVVHGVRVVDVDNERVRLAPTRLGIEALAWSPDGAQITGTSREHRRDGVAEGSVHVLDQASGRWRTVLSRLAGDLSPPLWSPDGQSLVVAVG